MFSQVNFYFLSILVFNQVYPLVKQFFIKDLYYKGKKSKTEVEEKIKSSFISIKENFAHILSIHKYVLLA